MIFNRRTLQYLDSMEAEFVKRVCKIWQVDFEGMKALIVTRDLYKKGNGKLCYVEYPPGRWIPFNKDDISYGVRRSTTYESTVYGLEEVIVQRRVKYLKSNVKQRLIDEYLKVNDTSYGRARENS